ncbi:MAG: hypothetical protein AAFU54_13575 [Chloroflexota bacterium]
MLSLEAEIAAILRDQPEAVQRAVLDIMRAVVSGLRDVREE